MRTRAITSGQSSRTKSARASTFFTRPSSRPSRAMLAVTGVVILITLWLPYSPLAGLLGFVPLPILYLPVIFGIVALYFISAELTKRWFYRQNQNNV